MTRIIEVVLSVLITIALFVVIALFLPSSAHVERQVEMANPMSQVSDALKHFKRWNTWNPWYALDPRARYALEGPEFGVGARVTWNSILDKTVGQGSLEIVEFEPEQRVRMALVNPWRGHNKSYTFTLEQNSQTNAVTLKWTIDVDYGWDLLGRYAGLYLNGKVGELMNEGLGKFSSMMATVPNYDYSQVEIQVQDVLASDLLFVGNSVPAAPRMWAEAEPIEAAAWGEVEAFLKKNQLEATGPRRRIVNVLGEENNDFNYAYPVPPAITAPLTGNIRAAQSYAGRVISTQYRGHRVGLSKPRDMLKAYALTHGYEFDRDLAGLWEEWLPDEQVPGFDGEMVTADPVTNLYLPIR